MKAHRIAISSPILFLSISLFAYAQGLETKAGTGVTLTSGSEMHTHHLHNGGAITQNDTTRVVIKGNLDNTGTYSSADTSITEFSGSGPQSIESTNTLDFGRTKVTNNAANHEADSVTAHGNIDTFKIEVVDGHLKLCNTFTTVFSTDTGSADPMIAVKIGTILTVHDGATLRLSGGKLYVFSAPAGCDPNGKLVLEGGPGSPATIDVRPTAARYALEIQGDLDASGFKILNPDASGLLFKSVPGNVPPYVSKFESGTFDKGPVNGTYVNITQGSPIKFNTGDPDLLKFIRFDDSDNVGTIFNMASSSGTQLKEQSGLNISYILFKFWLGAKGGEPNDSEAGGENKIRWQTAAADPTNLAQFKLDGLTAVAVGGTSDQNGVVVKGQVSHPDSNTVQLEVEIKAVGTSFDGIGTQVSGLVASGSTATVTWNGLASGNYHWRARAKDEFGGVSNWSSFGANSETENDFVVSVTNTAPAVPTSANQYRSDGTTPIASMGTTNETTVVFKATVTDSDVGDTIKLQVEVKQFGFPFDGQSNLYEGSPVSSGSIAQATAGGLSEKIYAWRYRAIDSKGHASDWTSFPPDVLFDFQVAVNVTPPVITTLTHKTKDTTPLVAGTSPANAGIEVFANGVSVGTTTANGSGTWSLSTTSLLDGAYQITAKATIAPNTSQPSLPITLTIDTCPPLAPTAIYLVPQNNAVLVTWEPSLSSDVYGYHVYRKLASDPETGWVKLTTTGPVSAAVRKYRDTTVTNGTQYNYKVSAVDDAQND